MESDGNKIGKGRFHGAMVSLVGAGPGDCGLITVAGLARLRAARVVIYDALANPQLLREAPVDAELIDVGKRAGEHKLTQDQTNALLVAKARQCLAAANDADAHDDDSAENNRGGVVRLKGGDPYLFGRGAEEAAYLARHGIACEVIPGVTAGIAAPAWAGIPVTHRNLASSVTFVTGHENPDKPDTAVNFAALASLIASGGTVCFYMGIGRLAQIVESLAAQGLPLSTPAAVVQWGTLPRQRCVRSTLEKLAADVHDAGLGSPAIIVVGAVAGIEEPGLDYFMARPLRGQRVLVTRSRTQASELRGKLETLGAEVIEAPTIEIAPADGEALGKVDAALRRLGEFAWLGLTSVNAVEALSRRLEALRLDARALVNVRLAVVGTATATALWANLRLRADLVSPAATGEALAQQMIDMGQVAGKKVLLLRADLAGDEMPALLRQAGAEVCDLAIYRTRPAAALPAEARQALADGEIDWVTFTSASTARNLVALLRDDAEALAALRNCRRASIGPTTSQALHDLDLPPTVEAPVPTLDALVNALLLV